MKPVREELVLGRVMTCPEHLLFVGDAEPRDEVQIFILGLKYLVPARVLL